MKKARVKGLVAGMLVLVLMMALTVSAGAVGKSVDVYLNGDLLNIPSSFGAPFYDGNNRLQIPMRYIIESCGYDVVWNGTEQSATIPTKQGNVVITLGSNMMATPSGPVTMNTSAMAKDSRTYIPLRFALEALNFTVAWTGGTYADRVDISGEIGAASRRAALTAKEVAELASPAVFYIEVMDENVESYACGSGFFIDPTGIAVTNYHVIEGATFAGIITTDGSQYMLDKVLYYDTARDLAIFNVLQLMEGDTAAVPKAVPYLKLAAPSSIHNGDVAYAIGSPLGLQNSITDGLVSNKDRVLPGETLSYIQTSAPISSGNSGGALLNQYGEVIGVNTASLTAGQNLNLAIPAADVEKVKLDGLVGMELWDVTEKELAVIPPTNIRVVRQENGSAFIQWDSVPGADYYHFYYQEAGEESFWFDGENDVPMAFYWDEDYSVEYYGLEAGKTYNVIITSVKGGKESRDSNVLTFKSTTGVGASTVTPTTPDAGGIPVYADAPWAPDFGALIGLKPIYSKVSDGYCNYAYAEGAFDMVDILNYGDALAAMGYAWNGDTNASGMFYYNAANGHGVLLDYGYKGDYMITTK